MADLDVLFLCMCAFWAGFSYRQWGVRRERLKQPHSSWTDLSIEIAKQMRWVRNAHRFAGDEVHAETGNVYTVQGLGRFRITVERADSEVIEGKAA